MVIHFICRGNTFRSRVAQAYTRSVLKGEKVQVISSGIEAKLDPFGSITPWGEKELEEHGLKSFAEPSWLQTTQKLIDKADLNIFMSRDVYSDAKKFLSIHPKNTAIWDIPDVDKSSTLSAESIFKEIKNKVDNLLASINTRDSG